MARIPNALEMRELKYGRGSDAEKDRVAEELREAGRHSEAILLFDGRPEHPFLEEERRWALTEGRAFHLMALERLGVEVDEAALEACARAAEQNERWLEARQCWLALPGREAEIRRFAERLPPSLQPGPAEEEAEEEEAEAAD